MPEQVIAQIEQQIPALKRRFWLALIIMVALVLLAQVVIQFELADDKDDIPVVIYAARQQMLSQQMTKDALVLQYSRDIEERNYHLQEMVAGLEDFETGHDALLNGNPELRLPVKMTPDLQYLYQNIQPEYERLTSAARCVTAIVGGENLGCGQDVSPYVETMVTHEPVFSEGMNAVILEYGDIETQDIDQVRTVEGVLLAIKLATLGLLAAYVVWPALNQTQRVQQTLIASEELYRTLAENASDIIVRLSPEGLYRYVSPASERIMGNRPEELIGRSRFEFIHPDDIAQVRGAMDQALASGETVTMLARFRHRQGHYIWLESTARQTNDGTEIIAAVRDVTRRVEAEQALQESRRFIDRTTEALPDILFVYDLIEQRNVYTNHEITTQLGYTVEEIQAAGNKLIAQLVHPDDLPKMQAYLARYATLRDGEVNENEYRVRDKQGQWQWLASRGVIFARQPDGTPAQFLGIAQNITRRKEAELALQTAQAATEAANHTLRESEQRYRTLAENASDVIVRFTVDGIHLDVSPASRLVLGYAPEEMIGRHANEFVDPADWEHLSAEVASKINSTESWMILTRLRHKNGHYIWVENTNRTIFDEQGQPKELVCSMRDVSRRVKAEEGLRQSQYLLSRVADTLPDLLYVYDLKEARNVYGNREVASVLGYSFEEIRAMGSRHWLLDLIHPDDLARVQSHLSRFYALPEGEVVQLEYRMRDQAGRWRWFLSREVVFNRDAAGKPSQILGIAQDITGRVKVEEALRESRRFVERATETMPDILTVLDLKERRNVYVNREVANVLGYSAAEIKEMGTPMLKLLHPEDMPRFEAQLAYLMRLPDGEVAEFEYRMRDKQGAWHWMYSRQVIFTRDEQGIPTQVLAIAQDITAKKQAQAELQRAKVAAEVANRAKSMFLANMSHELRTPLNAILGFSQLMALNGTLPPEQRENVEVVLRSGEYLLDLINNVLEMSRIESGQATLKEEGFDLHHILHTLEEIFSLRAEAKGLHLIFEGVEEVPHYFYGDQTKLRQILLNLLSNAVKFTQEGGVALRVMAAPTLNFGREMPVNGEPMLLLFEVQDTGQGIAEEDLPRLFEAFSQTLAGKQAQEGTGLGLSISHEFVQLMGGEIKVSSTVGKGTLFTLKIPIIKLADAPLNAVIQTHRVVGVAPGQPRYRVLIAEDKRENRRLLVKLMANMSFEVQEALNGKEAVEMYQQWQPDLIWMDVRMPVMDGLTATRQIKALAQAQGHAVIIIAITASAFEHEKASVLEAGCDDMVTKPFHHLELFEKMSTHLGLQFLYADETGEMPAVEAAVTPEQVQQVEANLRQELRQAAVTLNAARTQAVLEKIHADWPEVANTLQEWVRHFRYDKIVTLLDGNLP